jgi:steroid 5-alpha reductase family enzyme
MSWWALLLLAWGVAAALQLCLWLWQRRTGSATIVDVGWAGSLAGISVLYAILGQGGLEHRLLVGLTGGLAFGRLTWLLAKRVGGQEDPRYVELRRRWRERGDEQRRFFVFFQAQALAAALLSLPLLAAAQNDHDGLEWLEWAGLAVWLAGAALEALADRQLDAFRRSDAGRGRVIDVGVWRFSRHPNYFGQWLTWCGYALIGLAAPWGWVGLLSPALMLYLILFVTGIPPLERRLLTTRGEAYRRYQERTSAFVPLPPRGPLTAG